MPTRPPALPMPAADAPEAQRASPSRWPDLVILAHHLLSIPQHPAFLDGIDDLYAALVRTLDAHADGALLTLLLPLNQAQQPYSAMHAVMRTVVATLAARSVVGWNAQDHRTAGLAALTMNVSMAALQDELAHQRHTPTAEQRVVMEAHARASARLLAEAGVDDPVWLEAVIHHHDATCGSLTARSKGLQIARLLQRTDLFVSQLRPQLHGRAAASAARAAQMAYIGEDGLPDEAGMHLVRTLGMFPPGSVLWLAGGETAVVVRRGMIANMPVVAVVADAHGQPCTPVLRANAKPDAASKPRPDIHPDAHTDAHSDARAGSHAGAHPAGQAGVVSALAPHQIAPAILQSLAIEPLLALVAPRPASPFGRD